ncbi:MAG: ribonuclease Z [Proteiniphilum sp.]|nr:ribonuclease Z [Proteiniphilum sp.]
MTPFQVTILGCGSAMPTTYRNPTSQLIEVNNKLFMIDCGEGTQLQMRKYKARMSKLHSIFISHLHGDHVFGLPGLLSTLSLMGHTGEINIYAHKELEYFLTSFMKYYGTQLNYKINHFHLDSKNNSVIYENKSIEISSFPLKHRVDTNGFVIAEKDAPLHMKGDMIDFYRIPFSKIKEIKDGADFITEDGRVIDNKLLTTLPNPPRKYAYCSDTAYSTKIIPYIKGADVLYHEATFEEADKARAKKTYHSTAKQAAEIAKQSEVKKLIVGHYSSRYRELNQLHSEAKSIFENTVLAFEGMKIDI